MGAALDRLLERFPNPRREGRGFTVLCPAHDDQSPSLHIELAPDGRKILLTCRAGCAFERILDAMGITAQDLVESKQNGSHEGRAQGSARGQGSPSDLGPIPPGSKATCYDYHSKAGTLLFQVVRYELPDGKKTFRQRKPANRGPDGPMWIDNIDGVPRVLYQLLDVLAAQHYRKRIYIVEGEKDVDNLRKLDLCATTNQGGAKKWLDAHTDQIAGAYEVVIIPDNDQAGREHATMVRDAIAEHVGTVKVLTLDGLPEKGDVSDWLAKGGTKEQLEQFADAAERFIAPVQRLTSIALTLGEFMEKPFTKPRSLLGTGIISAGDLFYLYGRPGIGKTYCLLQTIIELAKGKGVYGLAGPEGGPIRVGVLELELTAYWFQQRITQLTQDDIHTREWMKRIQVVARPDLQGAFNLLTDDWNALHRWCHDAALDLIFIDALSRAHTTDENKGIDFGQVLQRFDDLRFSTGTAVGLIHHEPKMTADGTDDDMNALRGHTRMQSDPNTLLRLVKVKDSPFFNLRVAKANNAPDSEKEAIWLVRNKTGGFDVTKAPAEVRQGNADKVRAALEAAGDRGLTLQEIQDQVGLKSHSSLVGPDGHLQAIGAKASGEPYTTTDKRGRTKVYRKWRLGQMSDVSESTVNPETSINTLPTGDLD